MTVQTTIRSARIRDEKRSIGWGRRLAVGLVALGTVGLGIGFSVAGQGQPAVIAPDSDHVRSLKNAHAENYSHPATLEELGAMQRFHEDAMATSSGNPAEAFKRFKEDAWSK